MSEVEKMYKLANVKPINIAEYGSTYIPNSAEIDGKLYPPFTAEKQLAVENIIFQCNFDVCELERTMPAEFTEDNRFVKHYFAWQYRAQDIGYYNETTGESYGDWDVECSNPDRKEALAGFVNALWDEHLTEEERKQVKEILE